MIDIDKLEYKKEYTQVELAEMWGYKNYNAIRRGIVTPSKSNLIILFVTKEKVRDAVQYNDVLVDDILKIQGEEKHVNDKRLLENLNNIRKDKIILFYRKIHHTPFIYYGEISIKKACLKKDEPSEFEFILQNELENVNDILYNIIFNINEKDSNIMDNLTTEGKQLYVKHIVRERDKKLHDEAIKIHGTNCMICGINLNKIYGKNIAQDYIEVHHINPLYLGEQTINPRTDVITVCPNCHRMLHRRKNFYLKIDDIKNSVKKFSDIVKQL